MSDKGKDEIQPEAKPAKPPILNILFARGRHEVTADEEQKATEIATTNSLAELTTQAEQRPEPSAPPQAQIEEEKPATDISWNTIRFIIYPKGKKNVFNVILGINRDLFVNIDTDWRSYCRAADYAHVEEARNHHGSGAFWLKQGLEASSKIGVTEMYQDFIYGGFIYGEDYISIEQQAFSKYKSIHNRPVRILFTEELQRAYSRGAIPIIRPTPETATDAPTSTQSITQPRVEANRIEEKKDDTSLLSEVDKLGLNDIDHNFVKNNLCQVMAIVRSTVSDNCTEINRLSDATLLLRDIDTRLRQCRRYGGTVIDSLMIAQSRNEAPTYKRLTDSEQNEIDELVRDIPNLGQSPYKWPFDRP